jgi:hypothetical protein
MPDLSESAAGTLGVALLDSRGAAAVRDRVLLLKSNDRHDHAIANDVTFG